MTKEISLDELRNVTRILFEHLERRGHRSFELDEDYYWYIHRKEDRYNPNVEPNNFSLGQLYDDWQDLQELISGESLPIAHHLVRLSAILTYIGDSIVK